MYRLTTVPTLLAIALAAPLAAGEANVAPFFTSGDLAVPLAPDVNEGDTSNPEGLVSSLVDIIDYNPGSGLLVAASGIAVVGASLDDGAYDFGVWQYLDAGDSLWKPLSDCSEVNAVVLPVSARIRFVPNSDFNGTANLTIRAWDGSDGSLDFATNADTTNSELFATSTYGGSPTAFSAETRTITMTVTAIPDSIDGLDPQPLNEMHRSMDPVITSIVDLIGNQTDADGDAIGIAIASLAYSASYTHEYRLGTTGPWTDFTNQSFGSTVLCLPPSAQLRITPKSPPTSLSDKDLFTAFAWDGKGTLNGIRHADLASLAAAYAISGSYASFVQPTVNDPPVIDDVPTGTTVTQGDSVDVDLSASDDGDESELAWVVTGYTGGTPNFTEDLGTAGTLRFTPNAGATTGSVTFKVTDVDGDFSTETITFTILSANDPPVIAAVPADTPAIDGRPVVVGLAASDDHDTNALAWTIQDESNGTAYFTDSSGTGASLSFIPDADHSTGSVTFVVTDSSGATAVQTISFSIVANETPQIVSAPPGVVAVAGQPWEALVTITDDNEGDAGHLTNIGDTSVGWLRLDPVPNGGPGRYYVHGTPGTSDIGYTLGFTVELEDPSHASFGTLGINVTTVAGTPVAVTGPTLPVSTPGSVNFGAIHPGSASNLSGLSAQVVSLGRTQARAFWWSPTAIAFGELPNMPGSPATAGIFLASLSAVAVSYDAPPQAAPYAITLPANSWSFIGIPPICLAVNDVTQSHDWTDFRLETTTGVPVDSETDVINVLAPPGAETLGSTRPWLWDSESKAYLRVNVLNTGTAYWIHNYSETTAYRLVRATSGAYATFGEFLDLGQETRVATVTRTASSTSSAADQPPAPPSSLSTPAASADSGGGSCGAGGLAGLLIAGLALIGLRPRRRN